MCARTLHSEVPFRLDHKSLLVLHACRNRIGNGGTACSARARTRVAPSRAHCEKGVDTRARLIAIVDKCQQFADIVEGKTEVAGAADKGQTLRIGGAVAAVIGVGSRRGREQADAFVVADGLGVAAKRLASSPIFIT